MPPPLIADAIRRRHGQGGGHWLAELPQLHASCADRWGLRLDSTMTDGQMSSLVSGTTRTGVDVVLKCLPDPQLAHREREALAHWRGVPGVVDLMEADLDRGALLLRRVTPGTTFQPGPHGLARVALVLEGVHGLRPPATSSVPTLADQIGGQLEKAAHRLRSLPILPTRAFNRLRKLAASLSAPSPSDVLLHGDMQPRNILTGAGDSPVLIDPRPSIGHPAFDAGTWALKQAPLEDAPARSGLIADAMGLHREVVTSWMRILAVETALSRLHHRFCSEKDARRLAAVALGE